MGIDRMALFTDFENSITNYAFLKCRFVSLGGRFIQIILLSPPSLPAISSKIVTDWADRARGYRISRWSPKKTDQSYFLQKSVRYEQFQPFLLHALIAQTVLYYWSPWQFQGNVLDPRLMYCSQSAPPKTFLSFEITVGTAASWAKARRLAIIGLL